MTSTKVEEHSTLVQTLGVLAKNFFGAKNG
jgi:hypothetical protein